MKLLVSVLFLAAATAAFAQNQAPAQSKLESHPVFQIPESFVMAGGSITPQDFGAFQPQVSRPSHLVAMATLDQKESKSPCYTMRSYRFARVDPGSDATRLSGYSTCQAGARFQLRDSGAAAP